MVHDYAKKWYAAKYEGGAWLKPKKIFVFGKPGAGKSTATMATTSQLSDIFSEDYTNVVKQATPTGCASYKMSVHATTVHHLFGLRSAPSRDIDPT